MAEVATGLVVLQEILALQGPLPFRGIVQEPTLIEPVMQVPVCWQVGGGGIASEQEAVVPPFEPTQFQVYELVFC